MNRIDRYKISMNKFRKIYGIDLSERSQYIINNESDKNAAIVGLTVLNNKCKQFNIKTYGYYISHGIEMLSCIVKIQLNRVYYDNMYGKNDIDSMINQVVGVMYKYIDNTIKILHINNNISNITQINKLLIDTTTHLLNIINRPSTNQINEEIQFNKYLKNPNVLDRIKLYNEINLKYGSLYKLVLYQAFIIGGDDYLKHKHNLNILGFNIGLLFKIYDDFIDISNNNYKNKQCNIISKYGIKGGYNLMIETKILIIEEINKQNIETHTIYELLNMVSNDIDYMMKGNCIDMTDSTI